MPLHPIVDNDMTHKHSTVTHWLKRHSPFYMHVKIQPFVGEPHYNDGWASLVRGTLRQHAFVQGLNGKIAVLQIMGA